MALTCLDTLVGLSAEDITCFTDTQPDDFDTSDSGYYLTDTDYGLTIANQCAIEGWTMLSNALAQAIRETKTDLRASLRTRFDSAVKPFTGLVGQMKASGYLTASGDYIGLRLRAKQQRGAKFILKRIYLALNSDGTYDVTITSNDPLFQSPTDTEITIASAATFTGSDPLAIELPLWSDSCPYDYLEYYISIPRGAVQPRNNVFKCCGSTPGWMSHFSMSGFEADTDTPAESGSFSSDCYGFVLDGYLACEELDWLCTAERLGGYHALDVLARTIQFRGASIAIASLLDTLTVNPCTGYNFENLNSRRNFLNQRYSENIAWITENVPVGATDCFACKPEKRFSKSRLIV